MVDVRKGSFYQEFVEKWLVQFDLGLDNVQPNVLRQLMGGRLYVVLVLHCSQHMGCFIFMLAQLTLWHLKTVPVLRCCHLLTNNF